MMAVKEIWGPGIAVFTNIGKLAEQVFRCAAKAIFISVLLASRKGTGFFRRHFAC